MWGLSRTEPDSDSIQFHLPDYIPRELDFHPKKFHLLLFTFLARNQPKNQPQRSRIAFPHRKFRKSRAEIPERFVKIPRTLNRRLYVTTFGSRRPCNCFQINSFISVAITHKQPETKPPLVHYIRH